MDWMGEEWRVRQSGCSPSTNFCARFGAFGFGATTDFFPWCDFQEVLPGLPFQIHVSMHAYIDRYTPTALLPEMRKTMLFNALGGLMP